MKLLTEGLLSFFKLAKIEVTDPRLMKSGTTEYLEEEELIPALRDIVSLGLSNVIANKEGEVKRKTLQDVQRSIKTELGITDNLDYLELVRKGIENTRHDAAKENSQDYSAWQLKDLNEKAPHLIKVFEKQHDEKVKGFILEAEKARKEKEDFINEKTKEKHSFDVFSVAEKIFLSQNPNGLVEDGVKKSRQIERFIKSEIKPEDVAFHDGQLVYVDKDGNPEREEADKFFAFKTVESRIKESWEHGFNSVPKPNGAPAPNGAATNNNGITAATKSKIDAYVNGDKTIELTKFFASLSKSGEQDAAMKYYVIASKAKSGK